MRTTSLSSSLLLTSHVAGRPVHRSIRIKGPILSRKQLRFPVLAVQKDADERNFGGRLVDENLIVLRKRIHEMKMAERNYEAPAEWMEWEKRYYSSYDSDVCEGLGVLQTLLMNTRPGIAIGMLALVSLSVPTSVLMILAHLSDASKGILSGLCLH